MRDGLMHARKKLAYSNISCGERLTRLYSNELIYREYASET